MRNNPNYGRKTPSRSDGRPTYNTSRGTYTPGYINPRPSPTSSRKTLKPKSQPNANLAQIRANTTAQRSNPAPSRSSNDNVTLKPLRNRKGKIVGYGYYKGNESQNMAAIPKKAPTSKAGKAALTTAIAQTPTPIAKSALKKQKEVLPAKQLNPIKKKAVQASAIASGVDPSVVRDLGAVKKVGNVQKKGKAASAVAQSGGDAAAQAAAASSKKPVKAAKKVITTQQEAGPSVATAKTPTPRRSNTLYDRSPRRLDDGENLKIKKKSKRKRRAIGRGTGQLRVAASGQTTNVPGKGGSGVNV